LIAVIPLRSLGGISQEEADTVTNLLETGLVKSVMFQVVEKSEIAEVLAAQEYSAEEYVDENFAAKVGKLLSAEQIVLGTLSRLGDKYFLTAKIIDVVTGRTLRADKDEANSIEAIASQAEILGYRLAGLQLEKNGRKPQLRFGDLLITTEPDNGEVLLNGVSKGLSPLLIEKVPFGSHRIAAKKYGMYGYKVLELDQEELLKVKIILNQRLGRLFIRVSEPDVMVRLDKDELGFLDDGIFPDILEGDHSLELFGKNLYAQTNVTIKPEETTTVNVTLVPVGTLHYRVPEGALTVISGRNCLKTVSGEDFIETMPVGTYTIETSHRNYQTLREDINIEQGKTVEFCPELIPTPEHSVRLERQAMEQKQSELLSAKYVLERELQTETIRSKKLRTAIRVFYGISTGFVLGSGTALILYIGAGQRNEALNTLCGGLSVSFGIIGSITAIIGTMLLLEQTDLESIKEKIKQVERELVNN
jgi:TolB-like protein